jgi:hypothetical protein
VQNLQAQSVDIMFSSGVRQDLNSSTAPPGVLVRCENLEFDELNRLVRRDGFSPLGTNVYSKTNSLTAPIRRTAQMPSLERVIFTDNNAFVYFPTPDRVSEAGVDSQTSTIRATLEEVNGIAADETGAITGCDCAFVNGLIVYAYVQVDATTGLNNAYVDVIDATAVTGKNGRVITHLALGGSDFLQPRVVISGGSNIAFILWKQAANIKYSSVNLGATPVSVSVAANLITDATNPGGCFDVAPMVSGWVFIYTQNTPRARIITYNSSAVVQNSFNWLANAGALNWTPSALTVAGDLLTGDVRGVGYDPATFMMESVKLTTALATPAYSRFDPGLDHAKAAKQIAIIASSSTTSLVLFSNYTSATVATNPRGHLHCYSMAATAVMTLVIKYANYSLASKMYRDTRDNNIYGSARFDDATGFQNHILILDFGVSGKGPFPQFHVASGRVPLSADNAVTGIGGAADLSSSGAEPGKFILAYPINIGASSISGNIVTSYTIRARGFKRFLSTPAQGEIMIGGATPLAYDGQRFVELSFYSYPILNAGNITTSALGGFMPQAIFQYQAVYEWTDAKGNRHQSPACPAITVDMSGAPFVAGTNSVFLTFPAYFPTRKQIPLNVAATGVSDLSVPVRVVVYRTIGGGNIFYRMAIAAVNNNSSVADDTVINDFYSDAAISVNEVLYTTQGILATTAPPPSIFLTTHAQRLWGIDGENPERIWCTKVLQPFTAPSYNQALQVLIPGAGKINGLAGQDGKLYALAENGLYLASYGDGPDDTGNGLFPSPQLITVAAGCDEPRSVVIAQTGIFYTGPDHWGTGIYLIPRGSGDPISIGAGVRTHLENNPICRGAAWRPDKARVEFLMVNSETAPNGAPVILYYHYDYPDERGIGQWTVAFPNCTSDTSMESLGIWDSATVLSGDTASFGIQTDGVLRDFGGAVVKILMETADIRPFGMIGYGQVASVCLFGTGVTTDAFLVEASYDSGAVYLENFTFPGGMEAGFEPLIRRWETPTQKLPDGGSIRIRFGDIVDGENQPGITFFHGLTLQTVPLGGNARLDDARRG